jgi:CRAL/TRIO domain
MITQEYLIRHLMLPGQIENWVVIADLGNQGFAETPVYELKGLIGILADNYSCRMAKCWVVNVSFAANMLWKIIRTFLDPETLAKVDLTRDKTTKGL